MFDTSNLFGNDTDDGVSPVIGVILMVAITVILAAVIGTFVLGLGNNVSTTAQAGVNTNAGDSIDASVPELGTDGDQDVQMKYVRKGNVDAVVLGANDYYWYAPARANDGVDNDGDATTDEADEAQLDASANDYEMQEVGDNAYLYNDAGEVPSGTDITVYGIVDGERQVIRTYTVGE